jgi:hypothetical protein
MSYNTIAEIAADNELFPRLVACAAVEKKSKPYSEWTEENRWDLAASPGWAEAWEYAKNQPPGAPIGSNPAVITDGMILAAIQTLE